MTAVFTRFRRSALVAVAALMAAGCATADPATTPTSQRQSPAEAGAPSFAYVVLEEDARVHFANRIDGFTVDDDNAVIFNVGVRDYYRATLWPGCGRDAQFEFAIGLPHRGAGDLSRFDSLIIDGRRCPIQTLDRIENPRITRARLAAQGSSGAAETPPAPAAP
jgi:hypothetical protein